MVDEKLDLSKLEQRLSKKQRLLYLAPAAFTSQYADIFLDSDNSFGDVLLADSYLKLMGVEGVFSNERINRTLDYNYNTNFIKNSPTLGVANMTLADGQPHDAFQAQDVWIGGQFSVASALKLASKTEQAEDLIATVYNALYNYSEIPFAAPEGFSSSAQVTTGSLVEQFSLNQEKASLWLTILKEKQCLLGDGRVNPHLTKALPEFSLLMNDTVQQDRVADLHQWLLSSGLKYTAGRYFRPGMIFSYLYNNE